jgi:23S rRNA (cytosine1962-C5)-methyltransferase
MSTKQVIIKKGREKPFSNRHPWVFSGAITRVEGDPAPGDIVTLIAADGAFLARGYWNPQSQIQVRVLTWDPDDALDENWWRTMIQRAANARGPVRSTPSIAEKRVACRLINAENDYLPGLIVDRYDQWLVVQALTLGIDVRKDMIAGLLAELPDVAGVYERSDVEVRNLEGLKPKTGVLWGEAPPEVVTIDTPYGIKLVDVQNGQKTGDYLDQAANHRLLYDLLTEEFDGPCRLLNLFSYTGGFGLAGLAAGSVHAVNVESSNEALTLLQRNIELNNFDAGPHGQSTEAVQVNVFDYLRTLHSAHEQFDIVVLDPPKFAHNKGQVDRAARGYKDINLNAFKVIKPGGYLLTFSCSGAISADLFQKIVFGALADSGRQAQIVQHLSAAPDHPVALTFPEGAYLKGLLLRVY